MMLSERYATCSSTGTRSAAPPRTTRKPTVDVAALLVDQRVLAAVEDRHGRRRHLDVVAREERHRREQADQPEQDRDRDHDSLRTRPSRFIGQPPTDGVTGRRDGHRIAADGGDHHGAPRAIGCPIGRPRDVFRALAAPARRRSGRRRPPESRPRLPRSCRRVPSCAARSTPAASREPSRTDRRRSTSRRRETTPTPDEIGCERS